jgi:hypothetical protein
MNFNRVWDISAEAKSLKREGSLKEVGLLWVDQTNRMEEGK